MNWKLGVAGLVAGLAFVSVQGCAADSESVGDEGDQEEAASTEDELTANAKKLVGAFHQDGPSVLPPTFKGLVFKTDGTFFADVDTGIRCITTPCPSGARLAGKFTATKNYVRLVAKAPGSEGSGFYGRYRYTLSPNGKDLHLTRADFGKSWANDLDKKNTYCAAPTDCAGQNMIVPACVGSFTCGASASSSNQCGWKCGIPASTLWPTNATKLVAESAGGGFTPPPPPGSTCRVGAAKYSLDLATKKLDWQTCDWRTDGLPLTLKTGSTTVTAAEMAQINAAMNAVKIAEENICGADKPLMTISVTTPAGSKTYTDSFYSCWGGDRTFIDNIGGVFAAVRSAAE